MSRLSPTRRSARSSSRRPSLPSSTGGSTTHTSTGLYLKSRCHFGRTTASRPSSRRQSTTNRRGSSHPSFLKQREALQVIRFSVSATVPHTDCHVQIPTRRQSSFGAPCGASGHTLAPNMSILACVMQPCCCSPLQWLSAATVHASCGGRICLWGRSR